MASTSSPIRPLDPTDPTALHEQAAGQIRRAIAEGQAAPGERLPPASDLAAVLGVNRNTVLRALRLLREEGVVEFRRGRGITVTGTPQAAALVAAARDLLAQARRSGYDRDDLIRLIQSLPDP
jgi:GntR family transcriptional regulator